MFPQRLKELRKKNKLTAKQFGDKFGLAESTISGYETGARTPVLELVEKFADFFEVSVDYLLGRTDIPFDLTEEEKSRVLNTAPINNAETTIHLLEEEAKKMGLSPTDPRFVELLSDAFKLLRLARSQNEKQI